MASKRLVLKIPVDAQTARRLDTLATTTHRTHSELVSLAVALCTVAVAHPQEMAAAAKAGRLRPKKGTPAR